MKDFESSDRDEIEAELLRLMRDPKCYTISTFGARRDSIRCRVRLIQRQSERLWVSEYEVYDPLYHGLRRRMEPSCFSKLDGKLAPKFAEHIAFRAAGNSKWEPTIIVGWLA